MPSGKAAAIREAVAKENRADLQLERTPWGKTGFVNVVEVKGKYQARLQVPGDGRGGSVKRKQHPVARPLRHGRGGRGVAGSGEEGHEGAPQWQALRPAKD